MIKDLLLDLLVVDFVATKIGADLLCCTLVAPPIRNESAHTEPVDRPKQIASVKAFRIFLVPLKPQPVTFGSKIHNAANGGVEPLRQHTLNSFQSRYINLSIRHSFCGFSEDFSASLLPLYNRLQNTKRFFLVAGKIGNLADTYVLKVLCHFYCSDTQRATRTT